MNKLFIGDNLTTLKKLVKDKITVDCVFTDPPYLTKNHKLTYSDKMSEEDWITFMEERFTLCHQVLKDTGTLAVHIDQRMMVELQVLLYKIFGKRNFITQFIWKKRASAAAQSKFATVEHEYIICMAKDIKKCKWNGIRQFGDEPEYSQVDTYNKDGYRKEHFILSGAEDDHKRTNQQYPLYVSEDDGTQLAQRFDKVSKTDRNPETRPKESYPLYYQGIPGGIDQVGEYKIQPHKLGRGQIDENIGTMENQTYPLYYDKKDENGDYYNLGFIKQNAADNSHGSGPNQTYPLHINQTKISLTPFPGSIEIKPMNAGELGCWRAIPATCQKLIDANMLVVKNGKIYQKQYAHYKFDKKTGTLVPTIRTTPVRTIILEPTNLRSNKEIKEIFGKSAFTYAKPTELIKRLLKVFTNEGDMVLDIFAGSGTTGQAAFEIDRTFILCQLDENGIPELTKKRLDTKVGKDNYEAIQ